MVAGVISGSVAVKHNHLVVGRQGIARNHQGVAGAFLRFLLDKFHAGVSDGLAHSVGLMTDDGVDIVRRDDLGRGGNHMRQQRLAADFVEHLGMFRFQPRALARSHDGDGEPRRLRIVASSLWHSIQYTARMAAKGWIGQLTRKATKVRRPETPIS